MIIYNFIKTTITKIITCNCKNKSEKYNLKSYEELSFDKKINVILDLDSTLIYSSLAKIDNIKDYILLNKQLFVYKRPYLNKFLNEISQYCDLTIYTSASKDYADQIINFIDKNRVITQRYYRNHCVKKNDLHIKDVSKFSLDEKKLVIIDDFPECHKGCLGINNYYLYLKII